MSGIYIQLAWIWTKCQWPVGVWLRISLIAVFCFILLTSTTKKWRKSVGGRYFPCGFGGRKEISVVNFVPGLYNFIITNYYKHKFKKNKVGWKSIRLSVPWASSFLLKDWKLLSSLSYPRTSLPFFPHLRFICQKQERNAGDKKQPGIQLRNKAHRKNKTLWFNHLWSWILINCLGSVCA